MRLWLHQGYGKGDPLCGRWGSEAQEESGHREGEATEVPQTHGLFPLTQFCKPRRNLGAALGNLGKKTEGDLGGASSLSLESPASGRERRLGSGQGDQMCGCIYNVSKAAPGLRQSASRDN